MRDFTGTFDGPQALTAESRPGDLPEQITFDVPAVDVVKVGDFVRWRSDCSTCIQQGREGFGPSHDAKRGCESGKQKHCTCSVCWG